MTMKTVLASICLIAITLALCSPAAAQCANGNCQNPAYGGGSYSYSYGSGNYSAPTYNQPSYGYSQPTYYAAPQTYYAPPIYYSQPTYYVQPYYAAPQYAVPQRTYTRTYWGPFGGGRSYTVREGW